MKFSRVFPISRTFLHSFALSVFLHVLIIGLFAFGVARGYRQARLESGNKWLELGAQNDANHAAKKIKRLDPQPTKRPIQNSVATAVDAAPSSREEKFESASANASSSEAHESAESRYIRELAELLNRNKRYPRESVLREQEGKIIVAVSLDRDGVVHEKIIESASPYRLLNDAALETVSRIGKFPAPPSALLDSYGGHGAGSLRLKIPISFQLER